MKQHFDTHHSLMKMNVMSLLQNKNDNEMIILISKDHENLVTYNCGATVQKFNNGVRMKDISFHPSDENLLAALDMNKNLLLSKNKGESWNKILDNVEEFTFAKYSDEAYMAKKERIFALRNIKDKKTNQMIRELIYSDDYFKKWEVALKNVEFFKLTDCCVYAKVKNEKMKVADAFGNFYYFFDLEIESSKHEKFKTFNIVENGVTFQTFATMEHEYETYTTNFLMKANWFGSDFKILFDFLVCDQFMTLCDVMPITSLSGVMLANRYKKEFVTFSENVPKSKRQNMDQIRRLNNIEDYKMSFISFDFGLTWNRIKAPTLDDNEKPFSCSDECFLNIHLFSSFKDFNAPASSTHMPGLIIASGSVGNYLTTDKNDSDIGLFISRNGGLNWKMIKRGNYIFELLDNGSMIVIANRNFRVGYIEYSFDSGDSWHKIKFTDSQLRVLSLTTKNSHELQKLIIDVANPKGYKNKSRVIALDFSNLHERKCVHDKDNPDLSDYEEFIPHMADDDNCYMGQELVILRKKPDRECFNKDKFTMSEIKKLCPCKKSDFHCDFGFVLNKENGKCEFDQEMFDTRISKKDKVHSAYMYLDNYMHPPKHCKNYYFATTGYRRNFGNLCSGGQSKETIKRVKCPGTFIKSLASFVFKFSIIVLIMFLVYRVNLHFFVIDLFINVQDRIKQFKKKREDKKKKKYEELRTDNETKTSLHDEEQQTVEEGETARKINSIFDEEDDEEEEENAIPF
jgi:hypothetical protein